MAKKKKKKKWIIIPVIALLAAGAIFGPALFGKNSAPEDERYTVIAAGYNDLSKTFSASGSIIGNETVDITTKVDATVKTVNVSIGDYVEEGDVLCVFDDTELQDELAALKKQQENSDKRTETTNVKNDRDLQAAKDKKTQALQRAQRAVDKAVKARDKAYEDYNKLVEEYNSHLDQNDGMYDFDTVWATLQEMSAALPSYDEAVTEANETYSDTAATYDDQIQAIQDSIDAQALSEELDDGSETAKTMKKLEEQIESCTITAPKSGIVTALNVNEGSRPMSSSIMTIVNVDKTVLEITIKETEISKLQEGMACVVTSKVIPDEELPAKITRIVNVMSADPTGEGAGGFKAEITLDKADSRLLIGMSASVEVTLEDVGTKLSVPYSGIVEEDGKSFVYVAIPEDDGSWSVKREEITAGADSDFFTEVLSGDIKEGDLIIESPQGSGDLPAVSEGERIFVYD